MGAENSNRDYANNVAAARLILDSDTSQAAALQAAQVHATLALAAAVRGLDVTMRQNGCQALGDRK